MSINQFVVHKTSNKSRFYGLVREQDDSLEPVATLSGEDVGLTDKLLIELNGYLAERVDQPLDEVLAQLPEAVQMAVRSFLRGKCAPVLGDFNAYGPIDTVKHLYFSPDSVDFSEHVEAAYMVGLGVRASNQTTQYGSFEWFMELRSDEAFVPASGELCTWARPEGILVLRTWTSTEAKEDVVAEAVAEFAQAHADGYWVRLHTFEHGKEEVQGQSGATSEIVVEVFDAPAPLASDDDD